MSKFNVILMVFMFSFSVFAKTIDLTTENVLPLLGPIDDATAFSVIFKLAALNEMKTDKPIYMYIDSPGGSVVSANLIIDTVKLSRRPVHTVSIFAASAAFNIVQALGSRFIVERTLFLTHNAYIANFRINELSIERIDQAKQYLFSIYAVSAKRLGLSDKEYQDFMESETLVRGENILKINAADRIVNVDCSKEIILNGSCPK